MVISIHEVHWIVVRGYFSAQVLEQDTGALAAGAAGLAFQDSRGEASPLENANSGLPGSSRSTAPRDHT